MLRAHPADVVLILGDVGEMREITEGADDAHGPGGRQVVEDIFQLAPGGAVLVAMEAHRALPDALDDLEYLRALLIAHGVAENPAQQPDILAQPRIRLYRGDLLGATGAMVGFGRQDLGHRQALHRLPGDRSVASFYARGKIKIAAAPTQISPRRPREGGDP